MIVSVFAMRDIFVSMTELPKNLRTKRAAFSSGMPDVNSIEFDLLAGCGLLRPEDRGVELHVKDDVFSSLVNCVVLFGEDVRNRVAAVLDRLLNVVDVMTELLLRMIESLNWSLSERASSIVESNVLITSSTLVSLNSVDSDGL